MYISGSSSASPLCYVFTVFSEVTEKASEFYEISSFSRTSHITLSPPELPDVQCNLPLTNLNKATYFLDSDIFAIFESKITLH